MQKKQDHAVLQTNGSGVLSFATAGGTVAGQVIQVVTATDSTARSTTSTSFVTASNTLSVSITPSSASNKIYVLVTASGGNINGYDLYGTIYRDATDLGNSTKGLNFMSGGGGSPTIASIVCGVLDSPSSTSSLTYQFYFKANTQTCTIQNDSSKSSITVFEIKG